MRGKTFLAVVFVFFALFTISCDNKGNSPNPPSGAAISTLPDPGVPKVDMPLSTVALEKSPCDVFSEREIETLGEKLKSSEVDDNPVRGLSCSWRLQNSGLISGGVPAKGHLERGLSDVFSQQKLAIYPYFLPIQIAGYPAIVTDRDERSCFLTIGVRDDQVYSVSGSFAVGARYRSDPCAGAQKAAEFIIAHLKESR